MGRVPHIIDRNRFQADTVQTLMHQQGNPDNARGGLQVKNSPNESGEKFTECNLDDCNCETLSKLKAPPWLNRQL
jgi:hypothetical protein